MRCIEEDWTVVWVEKVEVRCILELMARLEDNTLVVLLLLLGGRRLEGSDDGLSWVSVMVLNELLEVGVYLTSSKTSLSLSWVRAEHSTYLTAPSSLAILSPSSLSTGFIFCSRSLRSTGSLSSRFSLGGRKSSWVPTIRQGTPGQWWWTSGNHFSRTFSKEAGETTEKQTRKTSV